MRDAITSLLGAIARDVAGIAIIWCPDLGLRDWLVGEVEALVASSTHPFRTSSVEEAIASPDQMALVVPGNEAEVVLDLDGSRDRLQNPERPRTQPVVLFLLRDGDGARTLAASATSLWSTTGGNLVDPEALSEVDLKAERQSFEAEIGATPEAWLRPWRAGRAAQTHENFATAYRAMLLEAT